MLHPSEPANPALWLRSSADWSIGHIEAGMLENGARLYSIVAYNNNSRRGI